MTPSSCSGPDSASPVNASNTEKVWNSNITLLLRLRSPDVRNSKTSNPAGASFDAG